MPSVGVLIACLRKSLGDGGFVNDRSLEWHGFGGRGTSAAASVGSLQTPHYIGISRLREAKQNKIYLDFIGGKLE